MKINNIKFRFLLLISLGFMFYACTSSYQVDNISQQLGAIEHVQKGIFQLKPKLTTKGYVKLGKPIKLAVKWKEVKDKDFKHIMKSYTKQGIHLQSDSVSVSGISFQLSVIEPDELIREINHNKQLIEYLENQSSNAIITSIEGELPYEIQEKLLEADEVYWQTDKKHKSHGSIVLYKNTEEIASYYLTEGSWYRFGLSSPCWRFQKGKLITVDLVSKNSSCPKQSSHKIEKIKKDTKHQLFKN